MSLAQHRLKEHLGGLVYLLTIDAQEVTGDPSHILRITDNYGETGEGVIYQGNTFRPVPYRLKTAARSTKSNKKGAKVEVSDSRGQTLSLFIDKIGGSLEGATIREYMVYETHLDAGATPNIMAYSQRLDHLVSYVEQSDRKGELIIHTMDPLSKDLRVPTITFSAGIPGDTTSYSNVFPAADRSITEGR